MKVYEDVMNLTHPLMVLHQQDFVIREDKDGYRKTFFESSPPKKMI